MKRLLIGFLAGLIVATFAPRLASFARQGFDAGRELSGTAVEWIGETARP